MSDIQNILVTGGSGQLAQALQSLKTPWNSAQLFFENRYNLPVDNEEALRKWFDLHRPAFCINTAAYTAVDKAESEPENAYAINARAAGMLAKICLQYQTKLIHISTDYVFDGTAAEPIDENTPTAPINVYGASKLAGEQLIQETDPTAIIIRTAWVYSPYGHNFVKTMIRLLQERPLVKVVNDQIGAPTYAVDLAGAIQHIITQSVLQPQYWIPGIYHYSNKGRISWFEFAKTIGELKQFAASIEGIPSTDYPTPARRPAFSLLNTEKIEQTFSLQIPDWKTSLEKCLLLM